MPIIRKFAVQGHPIPKTAHAPRGPFPPEVISQSSVYYGEETYGDSLHEALDDIRLFRCKDCATILYEDELSAHQCEDDESNPDA
jgi:hypothetical protein